MILEIRRQSKTQDYLSKRQEYLPVCDCLIFFTLENVNKKGKNEFLGFNMRQEEVKLLGHGDNAIVHVKIPRQLIKNPPENSVTDCKTNIHKLADFTN